MTTDMIKPSGDRKVRFHKSQLNCYGLLPGREGTCPGATHGAGGCAHISAGRKLAKCYVAGLIHAYKGVYAILAHNTFLMKNATRARMQELLELEFQRFVDAETKRATRTKEEPKLFYRLHWSGDFFNIDYAEAAAAAMKKFPQVWFWVYTRSFFAVETLSKVPNLRTYVSLDPVNMRDADPEKNGLAVFYKFKKKYPDNDRVQICFLSEGAVNDFAEKWYEGKKALHANYTVDWPDTPPTMATCPVDVKQLPLEGGCAVCQKCLGTRRALPPIWFKP